MRANLTIFLIMKKALQSAFLKCDNLVGSVLLLIYGKSKNILYIDDMLIVCMDNKDVTIATLVYDYQRICKYARTMYLSRDIHLVNLHHNTCIDLRNTLISLDIDKNLQKSFCWTLSQYIFLIKMPSRANHSLYNATCLSNLMIGNGDDNWVFSPTLEVIKSL